VSAGRRTAGREAAARVLDVVGQVQAFGLASAAAVAERYVQTVDRYLAERDTPPGDGADRGEAAGGAAQALAGMERALLRSVELVATGLDGQWPGLEWPGLDGRRPATGAGPHPDILELPPVRAGECAQASLWVHNRTSAAVPVTLRAGLLASSEGNVVAADVEVVEALANPRSGTVAAAEVPPGGSAEVRVRVRVPAGTAPGHFHGLVTSTATPRQALPLLLEVLPAGERAGEGAGEGEPP
jgi:hypothetical protein